MALSALSALSALAALGLGACAPSPVDLRRVTRIEARGRFVWERPGMSPAVRDEPLVIRGARLRALVRSAQCRQGAVMWKGGIPATLVLQDGTRVQVDGFSFYGRFLRIHRGQWCVVAPRAWQALWQPSPPRPSLPRRSPPRRSPPRGK